MIRRLAVLLLLSVTAAQISRAVVIEYGRGNQMLIGKVTQADEELKKGDLNSALRDVNGVIATDAKFFPAYFIRAEIYLAQGKWDLAVQDCNTGLKIEPHFVDLAIMRANANGRLRRYAAALAEFNHVLALHSPRPSVNALALNGRAWLCAACPDPAFRDGRKAIDDAKRACSLTSWNNAGYIDTLATAYAEAGDFDSATKYEQKAINAGGNTPYYQNHLRLFQQHKPVRED